MGQGGGGVVVVAVGGGGGGGGGRVHFYMMHNFTNLPVSPGSFGPLKVGVKKFMTNSFVNALKIYLS